MYTYSCFSLHRYTSLTAEQSSYIDAFTQHYTSILNPIFATDLLDSALCEKKKFSMATHWKLFLVLLSCLGRKLLHTYILSSLHSLTSPDHRYSSPSSSHARLYLPTTPIHEEVTYFSSSTIIDWLMVTFMLPFNSHFWFGLYVRDG